MTELLTPNEVAELLKVSIPTLSRWRGDAAGPPFVAMQGSIRYPRDKLQAWIDQRTLGGTLPV